MEIQSEEKKNKREDTEFKSCKIITSFLTVHGHIAFASWILDNTKSLLPVHNLDGKCAGCFGARVGREASFFWARRDQNTLQLSGLSPVWRA